MFRSSLCRSNVFRPGLLATLAALIVTGCVSTYGYRTDQGGDYYYAEPSVDYYYDGYGAPYGSIGYGYYGGWYGNVGYGFGGGYTPYSRYGFPYNYYGYRNGYPYYLYRRPPHHRPHHRPPPDTTPPGTLPPGVIDDDGPRVGDRDRNRDGGPWRHLERPGGRIMTPQPGIAVGQTPPGVLPREDAPRRRIMVPQPGVTGGQDRPGNVPQVRRAPVSEPGVIREPPASAPAPERRVQLPERELRRGTTP